jgi:hypothetical protein
MDRTVTFKQEEISGRVPQPGLDAKTDRLTDRQSQCDFDFDKNRSRIIQLRVEERSNTSTVALRVVGDDEKGSLESERVNYGRETHETRTRE